MGLHCPTGAIGAGANYQPIQPPRWNPPPPDIFEVSDVSGMNFQSYGSQQWRLLRRNLRAGMSIADAAALSNMSLSEAEGLAELDRLNPPPPEAYELLYDPDATTADSAPSLAVSPAVDIVELLIAKAKAPEPDRGRLEQALIHAEHRRDRAATKLARANEEMTASNSDHAAAQEALAAWIEAHPEPQPLML